VKFHAQTLTDEGVRTLLQTRELVTRKPMEPQPDEHGDSYSYGHVWDGTRVGTLMRVTATTLVGRRGWDAQYWLDNPKYIGLCPVGEVGDKVWVRESHAWADKWLDNFKREDPVVVCYRAGGMVHRCEGSHAVVLYGRGCSDWMGKQRAWHPSSQMPKWAARIYLSIDEVSVEQIDGVWHWIRKCSVISTTGESA